MEGIIKVLLNALPEAVGALIATGILYLLSSFWLKRRRRGLPPPDPPPELPKPPKPEIYANLPSRSEFIGRKKERERVKEALNSRSFLICIDGIGGIGKTSLALEVVHECLRFSQSEIKSAANSPLETTLPKFAGFIWTSAKDRELRLNDILDAIARTLDWPGIAQQPYEEKRESVRKLLQTKPYLLMVDNFETITDDAIRDFLLKLPEPSKALITSREQKLSQAWAVSIKGLEQGEALALIRNEGRRQGLSSVEEADDQVLLRLYQATGGAPLAIKWSIGQIKQKGQSLDTVLAALHAAKGDIFEHVFARSWSLLSEDAQKVLMVMPIFAASASKDALEAASDVHHFALDEALGQLVQMWLVEVTDELEAAKRRYSVHSLTRAFAELQFTASTYNKEKVRLDIYTYFLETIRLFGHRYFEGYHFLEIEIDNILGIINWCYETNQWQKILTLLKQILQLRFLGIRDFWQERIRFKFGKVILEAAIRLGEISTAGEVLITILAWESYFKGDYAMAKEYTHQGITHSMQVKDFKIMSIGKRNLGWISLAEGGLSDAKSFINEALELAKQENDQLLIYALYSDLGEVELGYGNYVKAESWFLKSFTGFEQNDAKQRNAKRLMLLGNTFLLQNKLIESHQAYQRCLELYQKRKQQDIIAQARLGLAKLYAKQGKVKDALDQVKEAYTLFEKLGMKKYIDESQEMIERLEKII
ncbi:tetratricopeptide repeat protein, partial [candidate division KSB1 bacterium]|nr:tetratricopeptide repeat protein [candidate division KSB1 bacterium]